MEPEDIWRDRAVVEAPEPRVMEEPGARVRLAMMYWDCAFGVMVSPLMVIRAAPVVTGVAELRGEVESGKGASESERTGRMGFDVSRTPGANWAGSEELKIVWPLMVIGAGAAVGGVAKLKGEAESVKGACESERTGKTGFDVSRTSAVF